MFSESFLHNGEIIRTNLRIIDRIENDEGGGILGVEEGWKIDGTFF
jgi:hypothetical protein